MDSIRWTKPAYANLGSYIAEAKTDRSLTGWTRVGSVKPSNKTLGYDAWARNTYIGIYGTAAEAMKAVDTQLQEEALEITVTRTVRIVLCTGGPHCEIVWPENREPSIVCYGWFGADRFERPLTQTETDGLINAYGEWEDLVEYR